MKNNISNILKQQQKHFKGSLFAILLLAIIVEIQMIFFSFIMGTLLDIITLKDFERAFSILIYTMVATITISLIGMLYKYIVDKTFYTFKQEIKTSIYKSVFNIELSKFNQKNKIEVIKRLDYETNNCANYIINSRTSFYISIFSIIILSLLLLRINLLIFIIILTLIALNMIVNIFIYKKMYEAGKKSNIKENEFFALESSWYQKTKLVKLEGIIHHVIESLNEKFKECLNIFMKYTKINAFFIFVGTLFSLLSILIMFYFSIQQIKLNKLSIGQFIIAFNFYNALNGYISKVFNHGEEHQKFKVSVDHLQEIIDFEENNPGNIVVDKIENIELINLGYKINNISILDKINYTFKKGNIYCINGANGSGKSTMFDILATLIKPTSGKYLINGIDSRQIQIYEYRENKIAFALQDMIMLDESINFNIVFDKYPIKNIFNLPLNPDKESILDKSLSGGEQRKVTLERALSKNSELLLLDEPETFLDSEGKEKLLNYLTREKKNKIIILTSHSDIFQSIADVNIDF